MKPTRRKATKPQLPQKIGNGTTQGYYTPKWNSARPGADDHLKILSRHDGQRYFRDGRVEEAA